MHENIISISNAQFFKEVEGKNLSLIKGSTMPVLGIEKTLDTGFMYVTDSMLSGSINTGKVTLDSQGFYRTNDDKMCSYYRKAWNKVFRFERNGHTFYFCVAKNSYKQSDDDSYEVKCVILYRLEWSNDKRYE